MMILKQLTDPWIVTWLHTSPVTLLHFTAKKTEAIKGEMGYSQCQPWD